KAALILGVAVASVAAPRSPHTDWPYAREVTVNGSVGGFAELAVPLEVARHSQPELRDLRLVGEDGAFVPFLIERAVPRAATDVATFKGQLTDQRQERRESSVWVVDLGAVRTFDRIELEIPQSDFAKALRVEASDDEKRWSLLRADAGVFERNWEGRLRH